MPILLEYILYPGMLLTFWLSLLLVVNPLKSALAEIKVLVESKADRDHLTGMWNRVALFDALDLVKAKPLEDAISIGFIDIDNFKRVIRVFGHDAADAMVENVVSIFITRTGRKDFIARYDREQFIIIFLNCDGMEAQGNLETIREDIAAMRDKDFPDLKLTASIGVCDIRGITTRTSKAILQAVEQAAYMAKRSGKNRVYRGDAFLQKLPPPPKWRG